MTSRTYENLDAVVVIGGMLIVGGGIAGLLFFTVPGENLAVVSGLLGGIAGTVIGGYAGFRWGASRDTHKPSIETAKPPATPDPLIEEPKP